MKNKNETIEVRRFDMEIRQERHVGTNYIFACPECGETVRCADYPWWTPQCACRTWEIEVSAVGTLKEMT